MTEKDGQERDGSALCLTCGLCCRGAIFGWTVLRDEERDWAVDVGLDVFEEPRGPAFSQPCTRLSGTACEIYRTRPASCAGYRCRLLDGYLDGRLPLADGQATVAEAKRLAAEVEGLVGPIPFPELRRRWRLGLNAFFSGDPDEVERERRAFLLVSALCAFLDKHMVLARDETLAQSTEPLEKRGAGE